MTPRRALCITALALAAHGLLCPSCVQWRIGQNIRESAERHVGINPGEVYDVAEPSGECFTVARELSYEVDTPLVAFVGTPPAAQNIRMGERFRRVRIRMTKLHGQSSQVGERYEPGEQAMERRPNEYERLTPRSMGSAEVQHSEDYPWAVAAAVPFDCCIDPVLSVLSSAAAAPVVGVGILASFVYHSVKSFC